MNIGENISRAIKEGKWLNISYLNKSGENTFYWIAIKDIEFENKKLYVSMFNDKISMHIYDGYIYFDNIQSATVIEFTSYDGGDLVVKKIEKNLDKCQWLNYDKFNHNILNYYIECNILDSDPCQKQYECIPGIDLNKLKKDRCLHLNDEQAKKIISDIYHYDIKNVGSTYCTLVINDFSIDEGKTKFVIAYHILTFDPIKKSLVLNNQIHFNKSFLVQGRKHSLFNYINMDMDYFTKTFEENYETYLNVISNNLRTGECIDTRPDIMLLQREVPVNLSETYEIIREKYTTNQLPIPLKSFFGNISKRNNIRKKEPSLILYDKLININQMRVLYNSLKYPVTYVQGPPGTGKTQTIINVTLSAFYNGKTMLICSSNNKPVDGIVEKLNFQFNGEKINFPYLRLGNFEDVKKATRKIRELYNYNTNKTPREDLLNNIKVRADNNNAELIKLLNIQEKRVEIENCLENSQKLIDYFENANSGVVEIAKQKLNELQNDLNELPEISNDEITSLFSPLVENYQLKQFLFYKSLQYIIKLKKPRYSELITICFIDDDDERALEFNKWLQNDINMGKLLEIFPIIFSTNISSRRLGTPNFMFDLVVMDEAGQCNVATALLPIAKAESLLLVGDPNQLKPVIILEDQTNMDLMAKYNVPEKYNYKEYSILDVMRANDNVSKYILLKYHYRCGKKIINFSNQRYYNNSLNLSFIKNEGELKFLDVKNETIKQRNEAIDEAMAIAEYIKRNDVHDAYIITPFVNQKELLSNILKTYGITDVECGTIHSLQGAEKDTIILSTALSLKTSKKTFEWLKDNYELLNVAITRAKNKLIVASDMNALEQLSNKDDDLYCLVQYVKNCGNIIVPVNENKKIEIGKSNGSVAEDEFFKTITQFCSCHKSFEAERNVKITSIIKSVPPSLRGLEFDTVLYEKSFWRTRKPVIAFETNGGEHFGIVAREMSDKKKMALCSANGIKLVIIPNSFVKDYQYMVSIILSLKNKFTSIQESMFPED